MYDQCDQDQYCVDEQRFEKMRLKCPQGTV